MTPDRVSLYPRVYVRPGAERKDNPAILWPAALNE